jgi:hypothetical protein
MEGNKELKKLKMCLLNIWLIELKHGWRHPQRFIKRRHKLGFAGTKTLSKSKVPFTTWSTCSVHIGNDMPGVPTHSYIHVCLELELRRKQNILPIMCDLHITVQIVAPALASLLLSQSLWRHFFFSTLITTYRPWDHLAVISSLDCFQISFPELHKLSILCWISPILLNVQLLLSNKGQKYYEN